MIHYSLFENYKKDETLSIYLRTTDSLFMYRMCVCVSRTRIQDRRVGARTVRINKGGDHRIANVSKRERDIILFKRWQSVLGARLFSCERLGWEVEKDGKGDGRTATMDGAGGGMANLSYLLFARTLRIRVYVQVRELAPSYLYITCRDATHVYVYTPKSHTHICTGNAQTSGFAWIRIHYVSIQNKRPPVIQRPHSRLRLYSCSAFVNHFICLSLERILITNKELLPDF